MVRITYAAALSFAISVLAVPSPLTPDPAGAKNIGNGVGTQFIGGACLNSKDCASACCAGLAGAGICSGVGAQFQAGKTGCGFGDGGAVAAGTTTTAAAAASTGAASASAGTINTSAPGASNVGTGNGQQFITGQCFSDADCASTCCAKPAGVCSAVAVANDSGKQGCGFVVAGAGTAAAAAVAAPAAAAVPESDNMPSSKVTINTSAPGATNVGTGNGLQFITGQCLTDADCASTCCAKPAGVCSGTAVSFDAGKQGCGFVGTVA